MAVVSPATMVTMPPKMTLGNNNLCKCMILPCSHHHPELPSANFLFSSFQSFSRSSLGVIGFKRMPRGSSVLPNGAVDLSYAPRMKNVDSSCDGRISAVARSSSTEHRQISNLVAVEPGIKGRVCPGITHRTAALHEMGRSSAWKTRCSSAYPGNSTPGARSTHVTESPEKVDMPEEEIVDGVTLRHGFLNNSGVNIHYVECGQTTGKLVILVHGWPNFWYVWKNQFKALSEAGYHVIALDLRGYNLSSKPEKLESYVRSAVVGDFVRFIDQFGNGTPAIMVGHDWGSTISWCLAEDHPSKVEKLVTINMGRLTDFSRILTTNLEQLLRSWYIGAFQIPYVAEAAIAYDNCHILRRILPILIPSMSDAEVERHVKAYSIPGAIKGSLSFYRAAIRGLWHLPGNVPVVETPVTVIWGDKDRFLLPIVAEPSKETAPNARVVHLPQCAHWPMWDDPQLFNELLLKTLAEEGS